MRLKSFYVCVALVAALFVSGISEAADPPSPAAAMRRLLESGRAPEQRIPSIVRMICERGNSNDIDFIVLELSKHPEWSTSLKVNALQALENAATQRKVLPTTEQSKLLPFLLDSDTRIQELSVRLAGIWQVQESTEALMSLVSSPTASQELKAVALKSLNQVDPVGSIQFLEKLLDPSRPLSEQILGASILAPTKTEEAANAAVKIFEKFDSHSDPSLLLNAFLDLSQGPQLLASQLKDSPPSADVAKLMLRHMYSIGRADPALDQVLSIAAGIDPNAPPPTLEEMLAMVKEVEANGNPQRGEQIFRRAELSCTNCHAINKAGGNIGPDLSAMGTSSPIEYLIMSVLEPDQAIKEAFVTKVVVTIEGRVHQGIVAGRTDSTMTLRDATGKTVSIPVDDIDDEIEGKSLMPKGLTNFITHSEFIDLIAYLAELGKPGEFAIRSTPRIQRFQVLVQPDASLLEGIPTPPVFEEHVLKSDKWGSVYAQANGQLPLIEVKNKLKSDVVYLSGEINCLSAGPAVIHVESNDPVTVWLDDQKLGDAREFPVEILEGRHRIVVRTETIQPASKLKIEVLKVPGTNSEFVPVDGL